MGLTKDNETVSCLIHSLFLAYSNFVLSSMCPFSYSCEIKVPLDPNSYLIKPGKTESRILQHMLTFTVISTESLNHGKSQSQGIDLALTIESQQVVIRNFTSIIKCLEYCSKGSN